MRTISSMLKMQSVASSLRKAGRCIGFVPTMGCLHDGHLSLVRRARDLSDVVVVSIFVNPIQFGPGEDFARYPRDFRRDVSLCRAAGVDIVFCPSASSLYARDHSVYVDEESLSMGLCGASRPGHFRGVATVVTKLFHIVQPEVAVFGRKDFQQARVIERMVRDLDFPVRVVVAPIVRERDGLAMSSRNRYLSPDERQEAVRVNQALRLARDLYREGARRGVIEKRMRRLLEETGRIRVDYIAFVDEKTLRPVKGLSDRTVIALAVKVGKTRLIDNMSIGRR